MSLPRSIRHAWVAALILSALTLSSAVSFGQCIRPNDCLPPPGGCAYPAPGAVFYPPTGWGIRNPNLHSFTACQPAPSGGSTVDSFFDVFVELEFTTNGGGLWNPASTVGPGVMRFHHTGTPDPQTRIIDTEMLQLDLQGGSLPSGVRIRESPSQASTGQTRVEDLGGQYRIDSFFDVFTELSLDAGQTWTPATGSLHAQLQQDQPTPVLNSTWGTIKAMYQ